MAKLYYKCYKNAMPTLLKWNESNQIKSDHSTLKIKQVYGWVVTKDKRLVLVSKDNVKWQFPGGKPNPGESILETLKREIFEETSLDISNMKKEFFGYYEISSENQPSFFQIRYLVICSQNSEGLDLNINSEDEIQASEDIVRYVNTYSLEEALKLIPWLEESEEYKSFLKIYKHATK